MSDATTALAEVLAGHRVGSAHIVDERDLDDSGWLTTCNLELRCSCGTTIKAADDATPDVWALHRAHLAAAVVAAVRGLSPDLQAELIGGTVVWQGKIPMSDPMHKVTYRAVCIDQPTRGDVLDWDRRATTGRRRGPLEGIACRVVTPWIAEQAQEPS